MEQLFIISVYQLSKKLTKSMKLQTNISQAFVGNDQTYKAHPQFVAIRNS